MATVIKRESELEKLRLNFEKMKEKAVRRGKCTEEEIENACKRATSRKVKAEKKYRINKKERGSKFDDFAPLFIVLFLIIFFSTRDMYISLAAVLFLYLFIRYAYIKATVQPFKKGNKTNYVAPKAALKIAKYFAAHESELKGAWGEKAVSDYIEKSFGENFYLLNDVNIRCGNKRAQIDHLLVSPRGIFCFETKNYAVNKFYPADDEQWSFNAGQNIEYTKSPQYQSAYHADVLSGILPNEKARIIPLVVLANEKSEYKGTSQPCDVMHVDKIKNFILSHSEVYTKDETSRLAYKILRINRLNNRT